MSEFGFQHFAVRSPERLAIVDSAGRAWTRGELHAAMNRISRGFRSAGLGQGDVVAIVAPNCLEFVAVYMAATQMGAYVVPINWHLTHSEIAYVLQNSEAKVLVTHERLERVLRAVLQSDHFAIQVYLAIGTIEGFVPLQNFMLGHSGEPLEAASPGRMLMYTSATTGRPKAISLPIADARQYLERTIQFHLANGLELETEVHMCSSMLYHAGPLDFVAIALHMGHRVVLVERWEPRQLLELIERHRVTTTLMVPTMFVRLLKLPAEVRGQYDISSLKLVVHTAAPCPVQTKRQMIEWWGPKLVDGYGSAEGVGTSVTSAQWLQYPGTVGRPVPGSQIRILDDQGNEVPAGTVGVIYLTRYQGDRFEYKGDPEKTRAAYRGELFSVGDMGYVNEAGFLFICDRKIDMIICGGMNIYSAEIEQVLIQHPRVADCAVFGVPDEIMGEAVHATIQLLPGDSGDASLTSDILAFLRRHLSATKLPRRLEFVSELPRDPNGKLYKRVLRQAHWQSRETLV